MKPRTRESELKAAIIKADIPPRDLKVYLVLMERAEWVTAKIADKFQPRSLEELARWCHMSEANVKRSLNHLQRHGWVKRYRHLTDRGIGGRGHPTRYQLEHGRNCDCRTQKGAHPELVSGEKGAQDCTIKGLKSEDIAAGQSPDSAKSVREEGEGEGEGEGAALCEICCQRLDSYLASLGDTIHLACHPAYPQRQSVRFQWPEGSYGAEANK